MTERRMLNHDLLIPDIEVGNIKSSGSKDTVWLKRYEANEYENKYIQSRKLIAVNFFPLELADIIVIYSVSYCKICLRIGVKDNICYECVCLNDIKFTSLPLKCIRESKDCLNNAQKTLLFDDNDKHFVLRICSYCIGIISIGGDPIECENYHPDSDECGHMGDNAIITRNTEPIMNICMDCVPDPIPNSNVVIDVHYTNNTDIYQIFIKLMYE
jgi:hypothetical protein